LCTQLSQHLAALQTSRLQDLLLEFALDMHDPDSPRSLMWATTPQPQDVRHLLNFPAEYLPLLQHKGLVGVLQHRPPLCSHAQSTC
jgi:hypothetical protein